MKHKYSKDDWETITGALEYFIDHVPMPTGEYLIMSNLKDKTAHEATEIETASNPIIKRLEKQESNINTIITMMKSDNTNEAIYTLTGIIHKLETIADLMYLDSKSNKSKL